jgi:tetratricopeptide (TPR) repeat protein
MVNTVKTAGLLVFLITGHLTHGQNNKEMALEKAQKAISLMDNGRVDESIRLLEEAQKLDPERIEYAYEIAYANYLKENYKGTIKILEKITEHKDVNERCFQLLGNSYDMNGKPEKAFEAYDRGLQKFPNSGMIYLEKGNVHWSKKEFDKALSFYEKGIEVNPQFPSNYYRATLIYCRTAEEVWGMIYGEIFMNLERGSKRTAEISKLLYDTYKSEIKFTSDTSFSVSFCQNASISIDNLLDPGTLILPFGIGVYEPTLMMSAISEKIINLNSLNRIRSNFLETYFKNGNDKKYPNALFDYQKKVMDAGHMEAYNYWILMKGDEETFEVWYNENKYKWDTFLEWFSDNGMVLNESNKFYRAQY